MTSTNLDLVRSIYAGWERGDYSATAWADSEIEFVIADGPAPGSWTGLSGLTEGWRSWLSAWEEYRSVVSEYRELDDERILTLVRRTGRGKTSGMELGHMGTNGATLFHIRGGKVVRFVFYLDRERALANLGVRD